MLAPLIIYNRGDLLCFATKPEAIGYLEAVDVENNEYIGFDSTGLVLALGVKDGVVTIEESTPPRHDAGALVDILISWHQRTGVTPRSLALNDLVTGLKPIHFKTLHDYLRILSGMLLWLSFVVFAFSALYSIGVTWSGSAVGRLCQTATPATAALRRCRLT